MLPTNRREFLGQSLGFAAGLTLGSALPGVAEEPRRVRKVGANDRINVCVMGFNSRGQGHIDEFLKLPETEVVALCDVDTRTFARSIKKVQDKTGKTPRCEQDIRRILEDKHIDVISIATTNHWHALGAIWAVQAGKDVYVEKPVSHNVSEGRRMVEFARKYGRIIQTGTQSRSSGSIRAAMEFMHAGKLGKITLARALCYKPRGSIGKADGEQPIPSEIDYDLWLGPAPKRPLMRKKLHYDWHWVWDYGNGDLGNQGIHQMDLARWGLNKHELPRAVQSLGGRFGYVDDGETPNTQLVFLDYGDSQLIFEVRGLSTEALHGATVGNIFYGTEGMIVFGSGGAVRLSPSGEKLQTFKGEGEKHFANFIKAVQSRQVSDLSADIEEGHLSSALCHLGNISYRLGAPAPFNPRTQAFGDNKEAYASLARMEEHLAKNRDETTRELMKPVEMKYQLGRKLTLEPKSETFVGDREADALLTREYRAPFVVPAKV
jgi:predicted dehydrogenase